MTRVSGGFRISGSGLGALQGCNGSSGDVLGSAPEARLGYVVAWGAGGSDSISVGRGFPGATLIKLDGGMGSDLLRGTVNDDLLYAGESCNDMLIGRKGDDVLASRKGRDILEAGGGNDQLVTNAPCSGHLYDGGGGSADVAGFGHVNRRGVVAKLSGKARLKGRKRCKATRIRGNNEVLEGSRFGDRLFGNGRSNPLILGRAGNDYIDGRGGHDTCKGGPGKDCQISCEVKR